MYRSHLCGHTPTFACTQCHTSKGTNNLARYYQSQRSLFWSRSSGGIRFLHTNMAVIPISTATNYQPYLKQFGSARRILQLYQNRVLSGENFCKAFPHLDQSQSLLICGWRPFTSSNALIVTFVSFLESLSSPLSALDKYAVVKPTIWVKS